MQAKVKGRMSDWRKTQRKRFGGMTIAETWVQIRYLKDLKQIFARLADPGWWGDAHRESVAHWLSRRRAAPERIEGFEAVIEIDRPSILTSGTAFPIGGRIVHSDNSIVELKPHEAAELQRRLRAVVDETVQAFWHDHQLAEKMVRSPTGVIIGQAAKQSDEMSDREFELIERRNIREITLRDNAPEFLDVADDAFLCRYEGDGGLPSSCLVVRHAAKGRKFIALIQIKNGGTSPTMMFDALISRVQKRLYPWAQEAEWYDVWLDPFSSNLGMACVNENKDGSLEWTKPSSGPEMVQIMKKIHQARKQLADSGQLSEDDLDALKQLSP